MALIEIVDELGGEVIKKSGMIPNDSTPNQYALRVFPISGLVPSTYDYISLTYVASGNGIGEIETVVYKTGGASGTTVSTLTLAYNASNEITSVTRS